MTVVAFSLARFTPADIAEFYNIAKPRMDRGLWAGVTRQSERDGDRLIVTFPNLDRPVFRFERDRKGNYTLWFNDRQGWLSIGSGATASECLAIWRARSPGEKTPARTREAY